MDKLSAEGVNPSADYVDNSRLMKLRPLWTAIFQYKWGIVVLMLLAGIAANLVLRYVKPMYRTSATIIIESKPVESRQPVENAQGDDRQSGPEYLSSQLEILRSRSLAQDVVARLDLESGSLFDPADEMLINWRNWVPLKPLEEVWPFDPEWLSFLRLPKTPVTEQDRQRAVVTTFMSRLTIDTTAGGSLVSIGFAAHDPELAALVANTLAQRYIEKYMTKEVVTTIEAAPQDHQRLEALGSKLQDTAARLEAFRESEASLTTEEPDNPISSDQIEQLTRHTARLHKARLLAEEAYKQSVLMGTPPATDYLLQLPVILDDPLIHSLKERLETAEQKVAELEQQGEDQSSEMIAATAKVTVFKKELAAQVQRAAYDLESAYQAAEASEEAAVAQLEQIKAAWEKTDKKQREVTQNNARLQELENIVATNLELYDMVLAQTQAAPPQAGPQSIAYARIINPASPPDQPYKPNSGEVYLLLLAAAFGLGVLWAWIRYALDNSLHSPQDISKKLHVPALGTLPMVKAGHKDGSVYQGVLLALGSPFAEAIYSIRTSLNLSRVDNVRKVVLVTSAVPGEGKSTLALNLATALGQSKEVLLIDGDFTNSRLASSLDIAPHSPGLTDLLADTADIQDCLHPIPGTQANVMMAGTVPGNPEEVLTSKKCQLVMAVLKKMYSHIIIDAGSLQTDNDVTLLSAFSNVVVVVVRANATSVPQIRTGIRKLREVDGNIAGVVLNQAGVAKASDSRKRDPREKPLVVIDPLRMPNDDIMHGTRPIWQIFRRQGGG